MNFTQLTVLRDVSSYRLSLSSLEQWDILALKPNPSSKQSSNIDLGNSSYTKNPSHKLHFFPHVEFSWSFQALLLAFIGAQSLLCSHIESSVVFTRHSLMKVILITRTHL